MPRGGYRKESGRRSTWKSGKTKPVRVPVSLAEKVMEIARILDEGGDPGSSRAIDLSGIVIVQTSQGPAVHLVDLIRAGYTIKPERLARWIKGYEPQRSDLDEMVEKALEEYEQ